MAGHKTINPQAENARFFKPGPPGARPADRLDIQCRMAAWGCGWPKDGVIGTKTGGMKPSARVVDMPTGTLLLRFYKNADWKFGEWWTTAYELNRIVQYFGVDWNTLIAGQEAGKSAFHGALAVLSQWEEGGAISGFPSFLAVQTTCPLKAWHGEGDVANWADHSTTLKPLRLSDGKAPRQIFLPKPWTYLAALKPILDVNVAAFSQASFDAIPKTRRPFE